MASWQDVLGACRRGLIAARRSRAQHSANTASHAVQSTRHTTPRAGGGCAVCAVRGARRAERGRIIPNISISSLVSHISYYDILRRGLYLAVHCISVQPLAGHRAASFAPQTITPAPCSALVLLGQLRPPLPAASQLHRLRAQPRASGLRDRAPEPGSGLAMLAPRPTQQPLRSELRAPPSWPTTWPPR